MSWAWDLLHGFLLIGGLWTVARLARDLVRAWRSRRAARRFVDWMRREHPEELA